MIVDDDKTENGLADGIFILDLHDISATNSVDLDIKMNSRYQSISPAGG